MASVLGIRRFLCFDLRAGAFQNLHAAAIAAHDRQFGAVTPAGAFLRSGNGNA